MIFNINSSILRMPADAKLFEVLIGYGVKFAPALRDSNMFLPTAEGAVELNTSADLLTFAKRVGKKSLYGLTLCPVDRKSHKFLLDLHSELSEEEKISIAPELYSEGPVSPTSP